MASVYQSIKKRLSKAPFSIMIIPGAASPKKLPPYQRRAGSVAEGFGGSISGRVT